MQTPHPYPDYILVAKQGVMLAIIIMVATNGYPLLAFSLAAIFMSMWGGYANPNNTH